MDFGSEKTTAVIIGAIVLYLVAAPWLRAHVHQPTSGEYASHQRRHVINLRDVTFGNPLEDAFYGVGQHANNYDY
jgi:4-amino-4-deoxy-L-arabinose transferase-like glycosyltransferase